MPLLVDIGTYLAAQGVGTQGTDLFRGSLPDAPDLCMAVVPTGGLGSIMTMTATLAGLAPERPRVQILTRSPVQDQPAGLARAELAYGKLHNARFTGVSGIRYLLLEALQKPHVVGRDENNRHLFSFNVQVWKDPGA